jgi:hypothetical protein
MLTVVQVLGKGRSGSTLLDALTGQLPGVFSCGELWRLPEAVFGSRLCTCGSLYPDCEVWGEVIDSLAKRDISLDRLALAQQQTMTWSAAPRGLLASRNSPLSKTESERLFVAASLYSAISEATTSDVVVDSSKWPLDPILLHRSPDFQMRIVHLVRDPRAVAYSWTRKKHFKDGSGQPMDRHSPLHSSLSWIVRNAAVELVQRQTEVPTLLLRYEDLVADPAATMSALSSFVGRNMSQLDWLIGRSATLSSLHLVAGNPDRPLSGRLEIRNDDAWRVGLSPLKASTVVALTAPLMRKYGYR